jgi:predicted dehydrogenase
MAIFAADSDNVRLMILDPGHFHAGLIQREMYPGISPRVSVFAPLGPELLDYLARVSLFNNRKEDPTRWELDIHTDGDPMRRMLKEHPGNVVVLTGRNRPKITRINAALEAGVHVFADKPWIISSSDMSKLEEALALADKKHLIAYDIMTERYEITSILQRELVNDAALFGKLDTGTAANPAVQAKSVHHVIKTVAGVPLRRPVWFFDIDEYGEGLADVGTHVVDLVQWTVLPDQAIDYRKDIQVLNGRRWPLVLSRDQFKQVTGEPDFPESLRTHVRDGKFEYMCNNSVEYTLRGSHVKLDILWNAEAPHGDTYEASFRGTKSAVAIRQGKAEKYRPELYVRPVSEALKKKIAGLQSNWPGVSIEETNGEAHIVIPEKYHVGHEAHFAQVANHFVGYMRSPQSLPAWERAYMLAKYYVSTRGVEIGKK